MSRKTFNSNSEISYGSGPIEKMQQERFSSGIRNKFRNKLGIDNSNFINKESTQNSHSIMGSQCRHKSRTSSCGNQKNEVLDTSTGEINDETTPCGHSIRMYLPQNESLIPIQNLNKLTQQFQVKTMQQLED